MEYSLRVDDASVRMIPVSATRVKAVSIAWLATGRVLPRVARRSLAVTLRDVATDGRIVDVVMVVTSRLTRVMTLMCRCLWAPLVLGLWVRLSGWSGFDRGGSHLI